MAPDCRMIGSILASPSPTFSTAPFIRPIALKIRPSSRKAELSTRLFLAATTGSPTSYCTARGLLSISLATVVAAVTVRGAVPPTWSSSTNVATISSPTAAVRAASARSTGWSSTNGTSENCPPNRPVCTSSPAEGDGLAAPAAASAASAFSSASVIVISSRVRHCSSSLRSIFSMSTPVLAELRTSSVSSSLNRESTRTVAESAFGEMSRSASESSTKTGCPRNAATACDSKSPRVKRSDAEETTFTSRERSTSFFPSSVLLST